MDSELRRKLFGRILSLDDLAWHAKNKESVFAPDTCFKMPLPASWILFQQGATILRIFKIGLYPYRCNKKVYGPIVSEHYKRKMEERLK